MVINLVYLFKTLPSDNGSSDSFNVFGKFGYDKFYEVNVNFMEYLLLKPLLRYSLLEHIIS